MEAKVALRFEHFSWTHLHGAHRETEKLPDQPAVTRPNWPCRHRRLSRRTVRTAENERLPPQDDHYSSERARPLAFRAQEDPGICQFLYKI